MVPALAIIPDERTSVSLDDGQTADAPQKAVERLVGESFLDDDPVLGQPEAINGASGYGADVWAVIVLWAAAGLVGGAAWDATKTVARRLRERVDEARRGKQPALHVSAGAARLLAIEHVLDAYDDELGPLDTEAVQEPSDISGGAFVNLNYAAIEPWLVLLVSASRIFRYILVVMPDGSIAGALRVPLTTPEQVEGVNVQIPGGTDEEARDARSRANLPDRY